MYVLTKLKIFDLLLTLEDLVELAKANGFVQEASTRVTASASVSISASASAPTPPSAST